MTEELKSASQRRLARIGGQVSGIQRMVDSDRTCGELLQQIVAVRASLDHLGITFLSEHLQTCVLHQGSNDPGCIGDLPLDKRTDEIRETLKRFLK